MGELGTPQSRSDFRPWEMPVCVHNATARLNTRHSARGCACRGVKDVALSVSIESNLENKTEILGTRIELSSMNDEKFKH